MRVFSQINNCQQKQNKQKTDKTKRGAPLIGLAKSIYYVLFNIADPDLHQDPASPRCCLSKWSLHYLRVIILFE